MLAQVALQEWPQQKLVYMSESKCKPSLFNIPFIFPQVALAKNHADLDQVTSEQALLATAKFLQV